MMRALILTVGLVLGITMTVPARAMMAQVKGDSLTGRVFNSATGQGVYGLTVRLIAPRAANLPMKITFTNRDGQYRFGGLKKQRYLLEVSRGIDVVYRREIDASVDQKFLVALHPVTPGMHAVATAGK